MYVCLCVGVTSETVREAVADGAATSKQVAVACGAGTGCGRCKRTVRAIIASQSQPSGPTPLWGKVKQLARRAG
ncbi:MAG: (2Fe-2S)-binding protein [Mycobacteriaceae bacterium]|nr:(2Fe-2S)-binding protein [Mycobacteriaceae bacterium]MBV9640319.1 (2Fe-2S)-binding protein [Mycobacteriaceae bacterium]